MAGGRKRWLIVVAAAGGLAMLAYSALTDGSEADRLLLAARFTVRWSTWWFLAAFAARPMHQAFGGIWTEALRQRRYLGLGFAVAHGIHAIAFTTLYLLTDERPPLATLIGGGIGYTFIVAMALTSNDASQRMLGRNWKRLHSTGMWYLWFVFTVGNLRGAAKPGMLLFCGVLAALLIGTALLRFPAIRHLVATRRAA